MKDKCKCKEELVFLDDSYEDDSSSGYYVCGYCHRTYSVQDVEGKDKYSKSPSLKSFKIEKIIDIMIKKGYPRNWLKIVEKQANKYEGIYDLLELYIEEGDTLEIIKDIIGIVEEVR